MKEFFWNNWKSLYKKYLSPIALNIFTLGVSIVKIMSFNQIWKIKVNGNS